MPLLVKLPGSVRGGETVAAAAHLVDFAPTLLGLLGEPVPAELPGTSWLALDDAAPPRPLLAETHYPRIHYGWSELASVIEFPLHFIYGPDPELYDLAADPAETVNLVSRRRDDARRLKAALDRWDRTLAPAAEVDPETRRRLAALGYVGSGPAETEGPLPDPKTRVASMEQVREAAAALQAGRLPEAETELRRLLEREPGMADAWQQLGHTLMQQGRPQQAWEAYRQAVELSNGAPQIALSAATALLAVGRLEDARAHAMLAVTAVDDAWDLLAQVALREGKLAEAEGHVERALATRGGRVGPLLSAAELRLRQGRYEEAVELAEEAEREHPPPAPQAELRGLGLVRGGALARLGEAERAEEAFRREIERSPDLLASYAELAFLLGLLDRAPEAGATLRRMVETNPTPRAYAVAVETLNRLGDVASARRVLQAARDRWPGDSELRQLEASGPAP